MINIKATNVPLSNELRDYIEKRFAAAEKFIDVNSSDRIFVDVGRTTNHHKQGEVFKAEFNVVVKGTKFYACSEAEDIHTAIDDANADLIRQITETKDHKISMFRRGARSVKKMLKGISKRNPFTSKVD